MSAKNDHPVWAIYDEIITMKLNVCYLEWRQQELKRLNFATEFVIAVATSSAVTSFWFWQTAFGGYAWKTLGLTAALLAVAKPIMKITDKIQETSELLTDARGIHHELHTVSVLVKQYDEYKEEFRQRFLKAMEYKGNFIKSYKDGAANQKVVKKCYGRVLQEFPPEQFYVPHR